MASWADQLAGYWSALTTRSGPYWATAQWAWGVPNLRMAALLLGGAVILFFVLPGRNSNQRRQQSRTTSAENVEARGAYQRRVALPRTGNRSWFGKRLHRWIEPLDVAGVKIETKDKHIAIGATTGARKTTLIANMIMQATRPCIVIAGDNSPYALEAMLARGWRIWSADGRHGGLYVFEGTPNEAAQIVTVLLNPRRTAGDTGLQRGMARGVFRSAILAMDEAGVARSWPALQQALIDAEPPHGIPNRNFDSARANWLARIDELMEALGPALGHDISVLDCVRSECGLFFDLNAFSDLDLATCFGEAAVRLTQHAADKAGDFWWICDELALFDADLLGQIVRTCRIRRVKFVGASQIISDFGKTLRGLVKVWFVGEQTAADHESRKWCSDLTMGYAPPENFSEHATPPGFYYVVADGRTQTLQIRPWHHPKPIAPLRVYSQRPAETVLPMAGTLGSDGGTVESGTLEDEQEQGEQLPTWVTEDVDRQRVWSRMRREACGCLRWLGSDNGQGRPKTHMTVRGNDGVKRKISPTVYVLTYEWVNGEGSAEPTLDHVCHTNDETCPGNDACDWEDCENPMHPFGEPCQHGLCCEPEDLEPVSIRVNQERNAAQKKRYQAWHTARGRRATLRLLQTEAEVGA